MRFLCHPFFGSAVLERETMLKLIYCCCKFYGGKGCRVENWKKKWQELFFTLFIYSSTFFCFLFLSQTFSPTTFIPLFPFRNPYHLQPFPVLILAFLPLYSYHDIFQPFSFVPSSPLTQNCTISMFIQFSYFCFPSPPSHPSLSSSPTAAQSRQTAIWRQLILAMTYEKLLPLLLYSKLLSCF